MSKLLETSSPEPKSDQSTTQDPSSLHIYALPTGVELAAIEDESGQIWLFTESEWSIEGTRPRYHWDPKFKLLRADPEDPPEGREEYERWTILGFKLSNMRDTGRELVACEVCEMAVWEPEVCPDVGDDEAWDLMALAHASDCKWIHTKGFRT